MTVKVTCDYCNVVWTNPSFGDEELSERVMIHNGSGVHICDSCVVVLVDICDKNLIGGIKKGGATCTNTQVLKR